MTLSVYAKKKKDLLLKQSHHRIKPNNLHNNTISGLSVNS
jgi:hypothetical protein